MSASDLAASVPQSGHSYAMAHAASTLNPAAALNELFGGMTQVLAPWKPLLRSMYHAHAHVNAHTNMHMLTQTPYRIQENFVIHNKCMK